MPRNLILDRIFDGDDLVLVRLDLVHRGVKRVLLPLPVGPVTSTMPKVRNISAGISADRLRRSPRLRG